MIPGLHTQDNARRSSPVKKLHRNPATIPTSHACTTSVTCIIYHRRCENTISSIFRTFTVPPIPFPRCLRVSAIRSVIHTQSNTPGKKNGSSRRVHERNPINVTFEEMHRDDNVICALIDDCVRKTFACVSPFGPASCTSP